MRRKCADSLQNKTMDAGGARGLVVSAASDCTAVHNVNRGMSMKMSCDPDLD